MQCLSKLLVPSDGDDGAVVVRPLEGGLHSHGHVEEEHLLPALAKVPGHVGEAGGGRVVGGEDVRAVDDEGAGGAALAEADLVDGGAHVVHGREHQGAVQADHQVLSAGTRKLETDKQCTVQ